MFGPRWKLQHPGHVLRNNNRAFHFAGERLAALEMPEENLLPGAADSVPLDLDDLIRRHPLLRDLALHQVLIGRLLPVGHDLLLFTDRRLIAAGTP
ncbi:MAG: hypothetical protein ABSA67_08155 [Candidatus Brocadiia bacterium]|jgi:hypothetical protein